MKIIDLDTWSRKDHFLFFQARHNPCVSITTRVQINDFLIAKESHIVKNRTSDYLYYAALHAINDIPAFKIRIDCLRPTEYQTIDAAFTYIPKGMALHSNCIAAYEKSFSAFTHNIQQARNKADKKPSLAPPGGESQKLVYLSCLHKISFTSITNPWGDPWIDSVPRVTFGMIDKHTRSIPVAIEALHSLVDGTHITEFFEKFQLNINAAINSEGL